LRYAISDLIDFNRSDVRRNLKKVLAVNVEMKYVSIFVSCLVDPESESWPEGG